MRTNAAKKGILLVKSGHDGVCQKTETICSGRTCNVKELKKLSGLNHFLSAFRFSASGFRFAIKESAFRQELLLGVVHCFALAMLNISLSQALLLTALYAVILIVELLNTAIEAVVDMVMPSYNILAKKAKDLSSAAVCVAVVVFVVFWMLNLICL